jgi:hypothetical protein
MGGAPLSPNQTSRRGIFLMKKAGLGLLVVVVLIALPFVALAAHIVASVAKFVIAEFVLVFLATVAWGLTHRRRP